MLPLCPLLAQTGRSRFDLIGLIMHNAPARQTRSRHSAPDWSGRRSSFYASAALSRSPLTSAE